MLIICTLTCTSFNSWLVSFSCSTFTQVVWVGCLTSKWRSGTETSPLCRSGHPKGESTIAAVVELVAARHSLSVDFFPLEVDDAIIPNLVWVLTLIPPSRNPAWHRTMSRARLCRRFTITLPRLQWFACTTTTLLWWPWRPAGCPLPTAACPVLPWCFRLTRRPPTSRRVRRTAGLSGSAPSAWWSRPWTASRPSRPVSTGRACSVCATTCRSRSASRASTWPAPSATSSSTPTTCGRSWRTVGWWASTRISCFGGSWPWTPTRGGARPRTVGTWKLYETCSYS